MRTFTFVEEGQLGLTMREHKGRALVASVAGQAYDIGVPPNVLLVSANGEPLNMPYNVVLVTLASMPRPFALEVQLPEGPAATPQEREALTLTDALVLKCAGDNDRRLARHCADLRGRITFQQVGLDKKVAANCSKRAFDAAAELLAELPMLRGPQAKLRCMLRAWDCVLGVLGLCCDAPSADDFLPGMACAVLQAGPQMLISALNSMVNFSAREDYEDMWVFHFVATVGLVAQLKPPPEDTKENGNGTPPPPPPASEPPPLLGGDEETVWTDYSDKEPISEVGLTSSAPTKRMSAGEAARARAGKLLSGLARPRATPMMQAFTSQSTPTPSPQPSPMKPVEQQQFPSTPQPPPPMQPQQPAVLPSPMQPQQQQPMTPTAPPAAANTVPPPSTEPPPQQSQRPTVPSAKFQPSEASLNQLLEMGFERSAAHRALEIGGNPEAALQLLLDGQVTTGERAVGSSEWRQQSSNQPQANPPSPAPPMPLMAPTPEQPPSTPATPPQQSQAPNNKKPKTRQELLDRKSALQREMAMSLQPEGGSVESEYREVCRALDELAPAPAPTAPPPPQPPPPAPAEPPPPQPPPPQPPPPVQTSAPAPASPLPSPSTNTPRDVRCPSCTNRLRVVLGDKPAQYACPSCKTRFTVDPSALPPPPPQPSPQQQQQPSSSSSSSSSKLADRMPHLREGSSASSPAPASGGGAGAPPPSPGRIYQAACPRCQSPCKFAVPESAVPDANGRRKLALNCKQCEKPFAIQV